MTNKENKIQKDRSELIKAIIKELDGCNYGELICIYSFLIAP